MVEMRIREVLPVGGHSIRVRFEDGTVKDYTLDERLGSRRFSPLCNTEFFRRVRVAEDGAGVAWGEEIELSEHELWFGGRTVRSQLELFCP